MAPDPQDLKRNYILRFLHLLLLIVLMQPLTIFPGCTGQYSTAALNTTSSGLS